MATVNVTDASFQADVLDSDTPVLVDFWAEWCGPCRMVGPILDEIAAEYAGKLTIAKVNIDENPMTPTEYAVRGIPTMILFKNGQQAATQVGALLQQLVELDLAAAAVCVVHIVAQGLGAHGVDLERHDGHAVDDAAGGWCRWWRMPRFGEWRLCRFYVNGQHKMQLMIICNKSRVVIHPLPAVLLQHCRMSR